MSSSERPIESPVREQLGRAWAASRTVVDYLDKTVRFPDHDNFEREVISLARACGQEAAPIRNEEDLADLRAIVNMGESYNQSIKPNTNRAETEKPGYRVAFASLKVLLERQTPLVEGSELSSTVTPATTEDLNIMNPEPGVWLQDNLSSQQGK